MKSYVVLCRHGQRAPSRLLQPTDTSLWEPLALQHTSPALTDLFTRFPVFSHVLNMVPHDQAKHPFGALTELGAHFSTEAGERLGKAFPAIPAILAQHRRDHLSGTVHACATNYRRTQLTAQCLLEGLSRNDPVPSPSAVPVAVNLAPHCPMTFYDSHPTITNAIITKVLRSDAYQAEAGTERVRNAQAQLSVLVPALAQGTYGFDWPGAFDLFACLDAHSSIVPNNLSAELRALEEVALEHFVFRYWSYYSDPEHLSHFIGNLLAHMQRSVEGFCARPSLGHLVLYSCHDINLFALLIALGDHNALDGPKARRLTRDSLYDLWPGFACTITLECTPTDGDCTMDVFRDAVRLPISFSLRALQDLRQRLKSHQRTQL